MTHTFLSWLTLVAEPYTLAVALTVFVVMRLFTPPLCAACQPDAGYADILRRVVTAAAFFGLTVIAFMTFLLMARLALSDVKTEPITNSTSHAGNLQLQDGVVSERTAHTAP